MDRRGHRAGRRVDGVAGMHGQRFDPQFPIGFHGASSLL
jgi:hypothetical protein